MKNFKRYEIRFGIIRMRMIRRRRGEGSPWHRKKESEEMRKNTIPFRFRSHREFPSAWFA